jgi:hypothetical protein
MKHLVEKDKNLILALSRKVMGDYPTFELARILEKYYGDGSFK